MRDSDIHAPDEQGFIPSIHNYCDRRCERCRFMRQCSVGALEADDADEGGEVASERPDDLRQRMMKLMGLTPEEMDELEAEEDDEEPDEQGTDDANEDDELDEFAGGLFAPELKTPPEDEEMAEYMREQRELRSRVDAHPVNQRAMKHMDLVHAWVDERADALKAQGVELHPRHGMDIAVGLRTAEMQALSEAVQLIIWDHTMLPPKVSRSLHGLLEDGPVITNDDLQSDHNGTAKLCIELAHRSRAAWDVVCDHLPGERAAAAPIMKLLDDLLVELHNAFPRADAFVRPGFDAPRQHR